jgi:hypothetical protein
MYPPNQDRKYLKQRLRELYDEKNARYRDKESVSAQISALEGYIASADMSDATMRNAVHGWREQVRNLAYQRRDISEGIKIVKIQIDDIKRKLEPTRWGAY